MAKLDSLFKQTEIKRTDAHPRRETKWIHMDKLVDNAKQYRSMELNDDTIMLAELIRADGGVKQNLIVRRVEGDSYEIIAGHHRKAACRYLVEQEKLKEFEFLPCYVESLDDVHAEFELYSSNSFVPKSDYEIMTELERMKYLLENYPEEFPTLQSGRMVERLAKQLNMKKTTVGEYLTIANNLGDSAMEAFKEEKITKSAAVELASLDHSEQDRLIQEGRTSQKEVKKYKEEKEPSNHLIITFYNNICAEYDTDRTALKEKLIEKLGKSHAGGGRYGLSYRCSPHGVRLNQYEEITWSRLVHLFNLLIPSKKADPEPEQTAKDAVPQAVSADSNTTNEEDGMDGQLKIVNEDMDIEEEKPQPLQPEKEENREEQIYDDMYFYREQKAKLEELRAVKEKGVNVPVRTWKRQELIVKALELYMNIR